MTTTPEQHWHAGHAIRKVDGEWQCAEPLCDGAVAADSRTPVEALETGPPYTEPTPSALAACDAELHAEVAELRAVVARRDGKIEALAAELTEERAKVDRRYISPLGTEFVRDRIGRRELDRLRSMLSHSDREVLSTWEVVEIAADELVRAEGDMAVAVREAATAREETRQLRAKIAGEIEERVIPDPAVFQTGTERLSYRRGALVAAGVARGVSG